MVWSKKVDEVVRALFADRPLLALSPFISNCFSSNIMPVHERKSTG